MTTLRQFLDDHGWEICEEDYDTYGMSWFPVEEERIGLDFTEIDIDFKRAFVKIREETGD